MNSSYFPPTFEISKLRLCFKETTKIITFLNGLLNLLEFECDNLIVSLKQNLNLKIQMLAGNSLNSFLDLRSEKTTTLVNCHEFYTLFKKFTKNFFSLDKSILQIRDWLALLESMIKKDRADMSDSGHIYHMLERQKVSFLVFFACRFHGIFCGLSEK